jgi:hypothetical protein
MKVSSNYYAAARGDFGAAEYLIREVGKGGQEVLPEGFSEVGKWWNVLGPVPKVRWVRLCCEVRYVGLRRELRKFGERQSRVRWEHGKARRAMAIAAGRSVRPNHGFGRRGQYVNANNGALKGLWVGVRDAESVAERLLKWSEQCCGCGFCDLAWSP